MTTTYDSHDRGASSVGPQPARREAHGGASRAPSRGDLAGLSFEAQTQLLAPSEGVIQREADPAGQAPPGGPVASSGGGAALPAGLRSGIEALSGVSMADVRVHNNSGAARQVQAKAFTQGSDIHIGPGQGQHLAHEAWHVVQQKQGRVQATGSVGGKALNDDAGLESEADTMGARAAALGSKGGEAAAAQPLQAGAPSGGGGAPVQRKVGYEYETSVWVRKKKGLRKPKHDGTRSTQLNKMDSITKANGLDMQVDTNPTSGSMVEFVSDPFDMSPSGKQKMRQSLDQLVTYNNQISTLSKRDSQDRLEFNRLNKAVAGPSDKIYVKTTKRMGGNPQVSAGMTPDELHGILGAAAGKKATDSQAAQASDPAATALFSAVTGGPDAYLEMVHTLAEMRHVDGELKKKDEGGEGGQVGEEQAQEGVALSPGLQTIVWLMASYLKTIDIYSKGTKPFRNSKEITTILSRNPLSTLVGQISVEEQEMLKAKPDLLVDAVAAASGADMGLPIYPNGFLKGGQGNQRTVTFGLVRADWARGVALGYDMLTKAYWEHVPEGTEHKAGGQELHKSLGGYKHIDEERNYEQAIFEFRKIRAGASPENFRTMMINTWNLVEDKMKPKPE